MRKMKDSGVAWIGKIPEEWEVRRIGGCHIERNEKVSDIDYPPLSVTKFGVSPQFESAAKQIMEITEKKYVWVTLS